jgi:hypothetical protein
MLYMKEKIVIIYDLKGKNQTQKVQTLRKLYGYRDKSNYAYKYERTGKLQKIPYIKEKKMVLRLRNREDLPKMVELFNELKITFEVARI